MFGRRVTSNYEPSTLDYILGGREGIARRQEQAAAMRAAEARQKALDFVRARSMPQAYSGMAGPTMDGSEPSAAVIPPNRRRGSLPTLEEAGGALTEAMGGGAKINDLMELLKANQEYNKAEYVNGFKVRPNSSDAPGFLPSLDKGQEPLFDAQGNIKYIRNIDGAVESVADMERAKSRATAEGQAPYEFINVPTPSGAPRTISKSQAMGGDFMGMAPADRVQSEIEGRARGEANASLPGAVSEANKMRGLIQQLRTHPGRQWATGAMGVLPGIPGTQQQDYISLLDQVKGSAFLGALDSLRGTGQITEVEGRKATDAIGRLNRAQSQEGFMKALDDLEGVINAGEVRAQQRTQIGQGGNAMARPLSTSAFSRSAIEAEMRRRGLLR